MGDVPSPIGVKAASVAILLGLCFLFFFWRLGEIPFYDRGEPREGLVVWEMYRTGNWVLPFINGDYIPFKPPFYHWMALLAGETLGRIDEFSVRFPSALFATLGVLMTYFAAARLWNDKAGLVSGVVLATNVDWWQAGTDAQVDMTLTFFVVAALLLFYFLYQKDKFGAAKALGLALLLACATLAKGPVGVIVPGLAVLVFLSLRRDIAFVKKLRPFASATVFLVVAASWYVLSLWQGGAAFFFRQIVDENLRTAAGTYGHRQPIYYYLPVLLQNLTLWSCFIPSLAVFVFQRHHRLSDGHLLYPLVWFLTVMLFFTFSLGKRGVYILPLYPAVALLFGAWWSKLEKGETRAIGLTCTMGYLIAACGLLALGAFSLYLLGNYGLGGSGLFRATGNLGKLTPVLQSLTPPSLLVWISLALYGTAALVLVWALSKRRWSQVFFSLACMATATMIVIKGAFFPFFAARRTLKPFMTRVTRKVDAKTPLLFYRSFDYGAIFYARRHIPSYAQKAKERKGPFYLLMWEEDWKRLRERNHLRMVDISEGGGPTGRHRLMLVEPQASPSSGDRIPPLSDPRGYSEVNAD